MRYKAIAATLSAPSLLAMGIAAAEPSAKSSYSVDEPAAAVTQGPDSTTSVGACARWHTAMAI